MVSINRFKAEQMVDVFKTIITMRSQKPGLVANAVSKFSIICDELNLPSHIGYCCYRNSTNSFMRLSSICYCVMPPILISLIIILLMMGCMKTSLQVLCDYVHYNQTLLFLLLFSCCITCTTIHCFMIT